MNRRLHRFCVYATSLAVLLSGCTPSRPFYFFEDGDLSHYRGVATELEYPDIQTTRLAEVEFAENPLTLTDPDAREIWDLSLEEAMRLALENSKVMRSLGVAVQGDLTPRANSIAPDTLVRAAQTIPSVYTPALAESDPRLGVEAALSRFDAQFSTGLFWDKTDRPGPQAFGALLPPVFIQDAGTFTAQLSKFSASGTQLALRNNTDYVANNSLANLFPSYWNTNIEAEFRHPLLQGSGVDFNRIKGPGLFGFANSPINDGVYNGVTIARINVDIALADFEAGVRNLVSDVETAYWDLYAQYRHLDAMVAGRDSALKTWRYAYIRMQTGARGGDAASEAQAREQYFQFRGLVEAGLSQLYTRENRLRYMMGLAATDGRLIRPSDEPTTARVHFDWQASHSEALARAVELRQQRWRTKQRELELVAAKNFLLPRLDAVALYRWRGFGDQLINTQGQGPVTTLQGTQQPFDNAWQTLLGGDYQDYRVGMELNVPIGFRQQLSAVRNAELQLARERSLLEDQELELSHLLTNAIRDLDRHYTVSQTAFNRRVAAQKQVDTFQVIWDKGGSGADLGEGNQARDILSLLLDAQRRLAEAETEYYTNLANYNRAIAHVHFRKNSLLEYNGIYLAEGPWASKAYFDAERLARQRDAGLFINYGFTRPQVFSQGPIPQETGLIDRTMGEQQGTPSDANPPDGEPILAPPRDPEEFQLPSSTRRESAPSSGPVAQSSSPAGPSLVPAQARPTNEAAPVVHPAPTALAGGTQRPPSGRGAPNNQAGTTQLRIVQPASHDQPAPAAPAARPGTAPSGNSAARPSNDTAWRAANR